MKKLLLLAFVLTASLGYAQEMRLPDDKKKKTAKEEVKKEEVNTARTVETDRREQVAKGEEVKKGRALANYCIVRETGNPENKKYLIEVENDFSNMERASDEDRVKLKEMMSATTGVQYKSAIQALNALAIQGYRVSSTLSYQSGDNIIKEYILLRTE